MPKLIDLTGQRFGRWVVIRRAEKLAGHETMWLCVCDCGTESAVGSYFLRFGKSQSCGCKFQHKMSRTPEYRTWNSMHDRCRNKNHTHYDLYGGRGIAVCDSWSLFKNFLRDMGRRPKGHTLDRINRDGDYTPENCRWATHKQQQRNRRGLKIIKFNGDAKSLSEWAEHLGVKRSLIASRLRLGWSIEDALTKPVAKPKYQNVVAIAKENGISPNTLINRLNRGIPMSEAVKIPKRN